jgi:uncharacterized protein YifE (UPF0438 family)
MDIDTRIQPFLTSREQDILSTHGDRMATLAWHGATPTSGRQQHFVDVIVSKTRRPADEFEHAWIKYVGLLALVRRIDELAVAVGECQRQRVETDELLELTRQELRVAKQELDVWDQAQAYVPWNDADALSLADEAVQRLSESNRRTIVRHSYLLSLRARGDMPDGVYSVLAEQSGLSLAIHNLEKIRRFQREGLRPLGGLKDVSALANEDRCNACDKPLSRCVCSL